MNYNDVQKTLAKFPVGCLVRLKPNPGNGLKEFDATTGFVIAHHTMTVEVHLGTENIRLFPDEIERGHYEMVWIKED